MGVFRAMICDGGCPLYRNGAAFRYRASTSRATVGFLITAADASGTWSDLLTRMWPTSLLCGIRQASRELLCTRATNNFGEMFFKCLTGRLVRQRALEPEEEFDV